MGKEIVYCDQCGVQILSGDFDAGRAATFQNRNYCAKCKPPTAVSRAVATRTPLPKTTATPRPGKATPRPTPRPVARAGSTSRVRAVTPRPAGPFAPPAREIPKGVWIGAAVVVLALLGILIFILTGQRREDAPRTPTGLGSTPDRGSPPSPPQDRTPAPATESFAERAAREAYEEARRRFDNEGGSNPEAVLAFIRGKIRELESRSLQNTKGYRDLAALREEADQRLQAFRAVQEAEALLEQIRGVAEGTPSGDAVRQIRRVRDKMPLLEGEPRVAQARAQAEEYERQTLGRLEEAIPQRAAEARRRARDAIREGQFFTTAREVVKDALWLLDDVEQLTDKQFPDLRREMTALLDELDRAEREAEQRAHNEPPQPPPEPAPAEWGPWTDLFAGGTSHSFSMTGEHCDASWRIENGVLIGRCSRQSGDNAHDIIWTSRDYSDYEVEAEFRIRGAMGQFICRARAGGGGQVVLNIPPSDAWHTGRIVVRANQIEVWLDGVMATRGQLERPASGHVGIGLSPGGRVEVRRFRIREPR
jgi:hypothetical protein